MNAGDRGSVRRDCACECKHNKVPRKSKSNAYGDLACEVRAFTVMRECLARIVVVSGKFDVRRVHGAALQMQVAGSGLVKHAGGGCAKAPGSMTDGLQNK